MAAKAGKPLRPGEWIVEIKVLRRVRVAAFDEIDAEHAAVKKLSAADRDAATDVRIARGIYEDGQAYTPREDMWWEPMHQICPFCGKHNTQTLEPGAVDGPREYHAECWPAASAAMTDAEIIAAWARSPLPA